jgi:hypothetical protein
MQMDIRLMPDLMQCVEDSDVVFAASGESTTCAAAADCSRPAFQQL